MEIRFSSLSAFAVFVLFIVSMILVVVGGLCANKFNLSSGLFGAYVSP